VTDVKAKCNTLCTNNAPADKLMACQAVCDGITDVKSGLQAAATLLQAAAKARFDAADPTQVQDALAKLKDAIATQRAFFDSARTAIADALDAKSAAIQAAHEARQDKIDAAKKAAADFVARYQAATTQAEKDMIKAEAKAAAQQAIEDAKAAWDAAKQAWTDKKKVLIDKVLAANMTRKDNQKLIVADITDLKGAIGDLLKSLQAVNAGASVGAASVKRATVVTAVVSCSVSDDTCYAAVNTALSGAVSSAGDVTITETTSDEVNYTSPNLDAGEQTTAGANTKAATDKRNSATSLAALGLSALVCVAATLL